MNFDNLTTSAEVEAATKELDLLLRKFEKAHFDVIKKVSESDAWSDDDSDTENTIGLRIRVVAVAEVVKSTPPQKQELLTMDDVVLWRELIRLLLIWQKQRDKEIEDFEKLSKIVEVPNYNLQEVEEPEPDFDR